LICPNCKNEKLDKDICPQCKLSETEALSATAENYRLKGNTKLAIEFYNRYLRLEPTSADILRKKANALHMEAIASKEEILFNQANDALLFVLNKDWDWEKGHHYRVNLFFHFGKLENLKREYETIFLEDEIRREICKVVLKIITLTEKFNQEKLDTSSTDSNSEKDVKILRRTFLPLIIGLPILLSAVYATTSELGAKDSNNVLMMTGVFMLLGVSILILILFCMRTYRTLKKEKAD
jgi:hypothetical protein